MKKNIIQIHGGLGQCTAEDQWLPYSKKHFEKAKISVVSKDFPNPIKTDYQEWFDFLVKECKPNENSIIVAHSMGAGLALRYVEKFPVSGLVIVSGFYTNLDDEEMSKTGFVPHDWDWDKLKLNTPWIIQYSSIDDPYIPIKESRQLSKFLDSEYYEFSAGYHFGNEDFPCLAFPHLVSEVIKKIQV